uniref:Gtpase-activating protein gyp7 n=1 Tax=Tetraselmis sp. GSL018 TaxID=582737 RepID=A0A061SIE0_9CHLO
MRAAGARACSLRRRSASSCSTLSAWTWQPWRGRRSRSGAGRLSVLETEAQVRSHATSVCGRGGWQRRRCGTAPHLNAYARHTARRLISLLSAYAVYDPEIGYCQGMSDLAAPFVAVLADDVEAFWCFESLMQTARRDFGDGGEGMGMRLRTLARTLEHHDPVLVHKLYLSGAADCLFAYRMVLVRMRRELSLDKCLLLWEVIWAEELAGSLGFGPRWRMLLKDHATTIAEFNLSALERERRTVPDLLTCFIADVIRCQRRPLLASVRETDDVARVFSAYDIDLWKSLNEARRLQTAMAGKIAVLKQASKKS